MKDLGGIYMSKYNEILNELKTTLQKDDIESNIEQISLYDLFVIINSKFELLRSITQNDKLFYVTILLSLHCKTKKELNEKTEILESELSKKSSQIRGLSFRQLDGFKSVLPLNNLKINGYDKNLTASGFSALFPIASPDLSHSNGIYLGTNLFTSSPVYLNSFIGPPMLNNQHITIFGIPGSRKICCY